MTQQADGSGASGSVVFLSGDLMFASRVRGAAEAAGFEFRLGTSLPADRTDSIRYVVLDLSTRSKIAAELPEQMVARCPQAKLVAYGPHVQLAKLKAAREAGIANVLTRGQFDAALSGMFRN